METSQAFGHDVGAVVLRFFARRPEDEGLSDVDFGEIMCSEKPACTLLDDNGGLTLARLFRGSG